MQLCLLLQKLFLQRTSNTIRFIIQESTSKFQHQNYNVIAQQHAVNDLRRSLYKALALGQSIGQQLSLLFHRCSSSLKFTWNLIKL